MASAVFKTVVTTRRVVRWVRFPHALASTVLLGALAALALSPGALPAQRPSRIGAAPVQRADTIADSLKKPPIAPRKAMLLSLVVPGAAQARLKRSNAAILFGTVEVVALGMARQSAQELRAAKQAGRDSVPTGYTVNSAGVVVPSGYTKNRLAARIGARHAHLEDWLAALVFNHILSAADAYVAANLWDFQANVSVDPGQKRASIGAALPF